MKRVELGIKQKDLALKIGISQQYLAKIENGNAKNPNREIMIKISKALNSDVQTLFFSDEE